MINKLDSLCSRAVNIVFSPEEDGGIPGTNGVNKITLTVVELNELYSEIMSNVSEYPVVEESPLTPDQLEDFSLPPPYFHTHPVVKVTSGVIKDKLKEIITNLSGKPRRHKKLSGRRATKVSSSLSQDSGSVDHEYIPPSDDQTSHQSSSRRPSSAPASRIHSISEAGDPRDRPETVSVPTSPMPQCGSPISPAVSLGSNQQEPFDDPSSSDHDPSESTSINSNTSNSRSRSQSPTSSENGSSFYPSYSLHRGSIPDYGTGNRIRLDSIGRRFSAPYVDSITRSGTLVRMQKKNGMNTIRIRKKSIANSLLLSFPKVLKIVIAGDDRMINNVASAYTDLRCVVCVRYVCVVCVCARLCKCACACVSVRVRV